MAANGSAPSGRLAGGAWLGARVVTTNNLGIEVESAPSLDRAWRVVETFG